MNIMVLTKIKHTTKFHDPPFYSARGGGFLQLQEFSESFFFCPSLCIIISICFSIWLFSRNATMSLTSPMLCSNINLVIFVKFQFLWSSLHMGSYAYYIELDKNETWCKLVVARWIAFFLLFAQISRSSHLNMRHIGQLEIHQLSIINGCMLYRSL